MLAASLEADKNTGMLYLMHNDFYVLILRAQFVKLDIITHVIMCGWPRNKWPGHLSYIQRYKRPQRGIDGQPSNKIDPRSLKVDRSLLLPFLEQQLRLK